MSEKFSPPIEAKLESKQDITIPIESVEQEDGRWHIRGNDADIVVAFPTGRADFRITGTIYGFTFEGAICHDKRFPERALSYKAEKLGDNFSIEIVTRSGESTLPVKNIEFKKWPIPKIEPFDSMTGFGHAELPGYGKNIFCMKTDGTGGERVIAWLPHLRQWVTAPEGTTITAQTSRRSGEALPFSFVFGYMDQEKAMQVLAEQMGEPVPQQLLMENESTYISRKEEFEPTPEMCAGKIVRWFPEKGFGFMRLQKPLSDGKNEVFVHARDLCAHTNKDNASGASLFVIPEEDRKGWRVSGSRGAMCAECKGGEEQKFMNERAAIMVKKCFGDKYGKDYQLADSCEKVRINCKNVEEVIAKAFEIAANDWGHSVPPFSSEDRERYAAAIVSGDQKVLKEFRAGVAAFQKEEERASNEKRRETERNYLEIWTKAVNKQEEYIANVNWVTEQAQAIREWINEKKVDPTTFSLSVDYQPVISYSTKGYGRNEDEVESSFEGLAYVIVARGGRPSKDAADLRITMEDFFASEKFYKENEYKLPYGLYGAFKYFIRKEAAVEARDAIAKQLSDIQQQREVRIEQDHAEALVFDAEADKLLQARKKIEAVQERARMYFVDLKTPHDYERGDVDKNSVEELEKAIQSMERYLARAEQELANTLQQRGEKERHDAADKVTEVARREAKEAAEMEEFGASGYSLLVARALSAEAERKLGLSTAQKLVNDTLNASYGRAGRQGDIKAALGETVPEEVARFYGYGRAGDVNFVLEAVSRILAARGAVQSGTLLPQESALSVEIKPQQTAEQKKELRKIEVDNKGWYKCDKGHSNRLVKTVREELNNGKRVELPCTICHEIVGFAEKKKDE